MRDVRLVVLGGHVAPLVAAGSGGTALGLGFAKALHGPNAPAETFAPPARARIIFLSFAHVGAGPDGPAQLDEPFGLTILEAMACGTPVVATFSQSEHAVADYLVGNFSRFGSLQLLEQWDSLDAATRLMWRRAARLLVGKSGRAVRPERHDTEHGPPSQVVVTLPIRRHAPPVVATGQPTPEKREVLLAA